MEKVITVKTSTGDNVEFIDSDMRSFRERIRGVVLTEEDSGFDMYRKVWNGMIDRKPSMIVRCIDAADVAAAVNLASDRDFELSVKGGGHNVAGHAVTEGGIMIDLSSMRKVSVDMNTRTLRAEGGARLTDLDMAAQAYDMAVPVGLVSETGIAGLTLGGGFGHLLRNYGMTSDNLLSVDIVTADGRKLSADASENPDLFWALRGGGGNFGIVTSFEFMMHPVGPQVALGMPMYSLDQAETVLSFFNSYMLEAPDELGVLATLWTSPEDPSLPDQARGKPVLILLAVYSGNIEDGERVIRPLRNIVRPLADLSTRMPYLEVQKLLDADYPDGRSYYWKSTNLTGLDSGSISALADWARRRPSVLSSIDIWTLGGAFARMDPEASPLAIRDVMYVAGIEANWDDPDDSDANIGWARSAYADLRRYSTGGSYLNFPGFGEEKEEQVRGAFGGNYDRLCGVKAKFDPRNLFRGNMNIPPAAP